VKKETLWIFCASSVMLTSTPHKQSLNRPNRGKPMSRALFAKTKTVAQKKKNSSDDEVPFCFVCVEKYDEVWVQCKRCKNWSHEDFAKLADGGCHFCGTCTHK
jgi:hypothetical protein